MSHAAATDCEHYVQKQVRAVCEPVLVVPGLDFDRVIGDATQLNLFSQPREFDYRLQPSRY